MRLALFQPDIAPNVGTLIRLGACLDVAVDIILPCGFPASDKSLRRAAVDYADMAEVVRHSDFASFNAGRQAAGQRLVLVETSGTCAHTSFAFAASDILLLGRESAGTPPEVEAACDAVVRIPMRAGARSLNVAMAGAIALSEALRQTGGHEH
jgi:tRNA (cytidine/uridine-2'-O-)-methyltransferase